MMALVPGDYLFGACTRINKKTRRPMLDVPKMWVIGRYDKSRILMLTLTIHYSERIYRTSNRKSF